MKSRGKAIHVSIARIGEQQIVLTAISVSHCHHIRISPLKRNTVDIKIKATYNSMIKDTVATLILYIA